MCSLADHCCPESVTNLQAILHVVHAEDILGDVFDQSLLVSVLDGAHETHDAAFDSNFQVRSVNVGMGHQAIADLFANPLIGPAVTFRATTKETATSGRTRDSRVGVIAWRGESERFCRRAVMRMWTERSWRQSLTTGIRPDPIRWIIRVWDFSRNAAERANVVGAVIAVVGAIDIAVCVTRLATRFLRPRPSIVRPRPCPFAIEIGRVSEFVGRARMARLSRHGRAHISVSTR